MKNRRWIREDGSQRTEVRGRKSEIIRWKPDRGQVLISVISFLFSVICLLSSVSVASAYERILVLYAAASPVLEEIGVGEKVVGVTRTDAVFTDAVKIGSHLRPNIELVNALKPDLIIAGSKRVFNKGMKGRAKARVFHFDPRTLDEITDKIRLLGGLLNKEEEAEALVGRLKSRLSALVKPGWRPTVVYEITERPVRVAGERSIVTSIIEAAGGVNLVETAKKHVLISPERVINTPPDYYIYQVGPMNKNPQPPKERSYFRSLKSATLRVDEYEFARPGINAFDAAVKLNMIFRGKLKDAY